MQTTESYMAQLNMNQRIQDGLRQALIVLSLFVTIGVFWGLKLTGITMAGEAFCGLDEHVHGEVCGLPELICEIEESDPHVHDETCLIRTLQCELEEQENHIHEESCYLVEEGGYLCGLEESEGHTHDDACYQAAEPCTMEEHIHVESCYSDLSADLETSDDWEKTLEGLDLTDNRAENMVLIARSQLGYTESTANFQVDEQLVRRGITRYGQWYGNPYGDWSAMFVGFCLRYSGAEDMPVNAGPEAMRLEWEEAQLYGNAADFLPAGGYLLFLDKDENGTADAVAIICGVADGMISAIEGDLQDAVAETAYPENDPAIMGYGRIATAPQLQFQPSEGATLIAQTESDEATLFVDGSHLVIYVEDETGCYVLDGNGAFFPVGIDENGDMYAETEDPQQLIWVVSESENGIEIFNLVTQMRLPEGGINPLAMTDLDDEPVAGSTGGNYQYARAATYKVWLDGTMGGLMSYGDASNTSYSITGGTQFTLPTTWNSTSEYGYVVQGWYDVTNNKYYEAGTKITVNGNMVFYPDWIAATYDIGQFNAQVAHTVSTNEFVTTRMFDYNALFNVLSSSADVSFSNNGHTETWKLITNGKSPYSGENTLNYIFRDWDEGSKDITYPNGVGNNSPHYPTDTGTVYSGLYNDQLATLLFDPQTDVIGKLYLGTADHLFQLCTDPNDANYGYYYYDSERNAASYNQSQQRFYVYDYLEQTTVSATTDGLGKYSDFLPLNSPYANT